MLVVKSAGGWLVLMLVASRRWRTLLAVAATYLGVAFGSLPFASVSVWMRFLLRLPRLAVEPFRYVSAYQTVGGLFGHLFVFDAEWSPHPLLVALSVATIATLSVMMAAMVQSLRFGRGADASLHARLLRLGIFDALIVTLAPLAEGYHYVLVLPAVMIAVGWAVRTSPSLGSRALLGASVLLLTAPQSLAQDFVGAHRAAPFALDGVAFLNGGLDPAQHRARPIQRFLSTRVGASLGPLLLGRRTVLRALRKVVRSNVFDDDEVWASITDGGGLAVMEGRSSKRVSAAKKRERGLPNPTYGRQWRLSVPAGRADRFERDVLRDLHRRRRGTASLMHRDHLDQPRSTGGLDGGAVRGLRDDDRPCARQRRTSPRSADTEGCRPREALPERRLSGAPDSDGR